MSTPSRITRNLRRGAVVAALATTAALGAAPVAGASYGSALVGQTATFTGDGASDTLTFAQSGGLLNHNQIGGGFNSNFDFATAVPGDQTLSATNPATVLVVNAGGGADTVTLFTAGWGAVTIDGEGGDDALTGNNGVENLRGGDDDDRLVGAPGGDDMEGGAGNDTLVWNNGDGSDVMDGDGGTDEVEVNGSPAGADSFTIKPDGARVDFDRVNVGLFSLDIAAERLTVNGLGGADRMTGAAGLAPLIALTLNGGTGADVLTGGDGADLLDGGDDADVLNGGDGIDDLDGAAGDDRIAGDPGADLVDGGAGGDILVWNDGDGSDVMDGGDDFDRVEVNGAGAGDAFTIAPNGTRASLDRTNLGVFHLDMGTAELVDVRGQGGDDTFSAADGTEARVALLVDGGAGNDTLAGSAGGDTMLGGSGNDSLNGGAGVDLLDGQDGDDSLLARDGAGDAARCGAGADSVQTDLPGVDAISDCESVDALAAPLVPPPPPPPPLLPPPPPPPPPPALPAADTRATPVTVVTRNVALRSSRGRLRARVVVSCPASEPGGCNGTLTLVTASKVRVGGVLARVVLGSARYTLRAGQRRTLSVLLVRGARRLARRSIPARAQTVTRDRAGNVATGSKAIRLRLPR